MRALEPLDRGDKGMSLDLWIPPAPLKLGVPAAYEP